MRYIQIIKSLKNNEQGSVLIMAAVFIMMMIAISGAAVDFGRAQLVQMKKQQSADMATLAAANIFPEYTADSSKITIREETAVRYYNLNFPDTYLGVTRKPITPDAKTKNITVTSASEVVPTNYINTMGTIGIKVGADTKVNMPDKDFPDFDVVVVVDESGSTKEKIDGKTILMAEKSSITSMLDVLFPDDQDANPNLRFGLIGYTGAIMQASPLTSIKEDAIKYIDNLRSYSQNYDHWGLEAGFNLMTPPWKGFVPPVHCGVGIFEPIPNCIPNIVTDPNNTNSTKSGYCMRTVDGLPVCIPQRNTSAPAPATVRTKINSAGNIDLVSPSKHMVLISDGYIMQEPSPCNLGNYYHNQGNWGHAEWPDPVDEEVATPEEIAAANANGKCKNYLAFTSMCKKIKDAGITLHVISFVSLDPADELSLKACATPDKYYYAPTEPVLKNILTGIATQVQHIRITD